MLHIQPLDGLLVFEHADSRESALRRARILLAEGFDGTIPVGTRRSMCYRALLRWLAAPAFEGFLELLVNAKHVWTDQMASVAPGAKPEEVDMVSSELFGQIVRALLA